MDEQRLVFEKRIDQTWANYWQCSPEVFDNPGATLRLRHNSSNAPAVHLSTIRNHTFIEHDQVDSDHLRAIVDGLPCAEIITADAIAARWSAHENAQRQVELVTHGLTFYLFPADLPTRHLPGGFALRRLTDGDQEQLRQLEETNSVEEVSEAYVAVDHEMACGVFQLGGQGETPHLVTAASAYERAGFVDPGVITHSDFRKRGFGSAAVHALCQWAIRQDRIMQYRCDRDNVASQGVARRLGFKPYVIQDSIWLK